MDWQGIWVPLVTPFTPDTQALDTAALAALVRQLSAQQVAGFVVCGSTGEAAMLSAAEQETALQTTLQAAGARPVLMGLSGVQPHAVAQRAAQLAADAPAVAGFLLAPPAYVKPSQAGLVDYYTCVADRLPRPLVVYDIPSRTGVRVATETLLQLAAHPQIVAVKDCSGDRLGAEAIVADGRLALLCGNDDELFDQLARGAAGGITVSAHLAAPQLVALQRLLAGQQLHAARALWRRLAPLTRALFAEPNPAPVKGALARQGRMAPALRAPLHPASGPAVDSVHAALAGLQEPVDA